MKQCTMQVYYVPRLPFHLNATMPTIFGGLRLLRCILIRESIQMVRIRTLHAMLAPVQPAVLCAQL